MSELTSNRPLGCFTHPNHEGPTFRVALINPEIPQNTGTIGRLALATRSELHLVGKLGFEIDEKAVRRAGLDYWKHVSLFRNEDQEAWFRSLVNEENSPPRFWMVSKTSNRFPWKVRFTPGDTLLFGSETEGLPLEWLESFPERTIGLPQFDDRVRSINLACAVSAVLYEGIRQILRT